MAKMTVVEELQRQLEAVRVGEWLRGSPGKFQQACLVLRTDAVRTITPEQFEFAKLQADRSFLDNEPLVWYEVGPDGGYIFKQCVVSELSERAGEYVARARNELGYLTSYEDEGADADNNVDWNDCFSDGREQVIEVLERAIQLAARRSRKHRQLVTA